MAFRIYFAERKGFHNDHVPNDYFGGRGNVNILIIVTSNALDICVLVLFNYIIIFCFVAKGSVNISTDICVKVRSTYRPLLNRW